MGYLQNQALMTLLFSIGTGLVTSVVVYLIAYFYKQSRDKRKVQTSIGSFTVSQKDNLTEWLNMLDKRLQKNDIKIKSKIIIAVNALSSLTVFIVSFRIFKNLTAAIFFAIVFFIIPEYILFLYETKRKMKIENQMVAAIRMFTAEYLNVRNIEKSFAEISIRVVDPVGGYFADAYMDILMGHSFDSAMSRLSARVDNEYWKMFIQLIYQLEKDSQAIVLFADLVSRVEKSIELSRNNEISLGGERVLALVMALLPLPVYYFMSKIVPQTTTFIVETIAGRLLITVSFISIFAFTFLDKMLRRIE